MLIFCLEGMLYEQIFVAERVVCGPQSPSLEEPFLEELTSMTET